MGIYLSRVVLVSNADAIPPDGKTTGDRTQRKVDGNQANPQAAQSKSARRGMPSGPQSWAPPMEKNDRPHQPQPKFTKALPCKCPRQLQMPTPTSAPTAKPTAVPTHIPTVEPTVTPTARPSMTPTLEPTHLPTEHPCADGSHDCDTTTTMCAESGSLGGSYSEAGSYGMGDSYECVCLEGYLITASSSTLCMATTSMVQGGNSTSSSAANCESIEMSAPR